MSQSASGRKFGMVSTALYPAVIRSREPKPPTPEDKWKLSDVYRVCLWYDNRLDLKDQELFESDHSRFNLSAFESEPLRQQVYQLWSLYCQYSDLWNEYRAMPLGASTVMIKGKIGAIVAKINDERDNYQALLKLSSDLPVDGYMFTEM